MTIAEIPSNVFMDHGAEATMLGMAMSPSRRETEQVMAMLRPEMFQDYFHQQVFGVLAEFSSRGVQCEAIVVAKEVARRHELGLMDPHPTPFTSALTLSGGGFVPSLAEFYVGVLENALEKRRVLTALTAGISQLVEAPDVQAREVANTLMGDLIKDATGARTLTVSLAESLPEVMDTIRAKMMDPTVVYGIPCGWDLIDKSLGGFEKTKVYTFVADTGSGKSFTTHWLAWQVAKFGSVPLIISTEMPPSEIHERVVFMEAGVNFEAVKDRGYATRDEDDALNRAEEALSNLRFYSAGVGGMEIGALEQEVIRQQTMNGIDIVFVDVLQHLTARGVRADNQVARLEVVTGRLKQMAMNRALPVVVISHVPRSLGGNVPGLHSGKGGSSIEQDTNVHISLIPVKSQGKSWEPFATEQEMNDYKTEHKKIAIMYRVNKNRSGTLPWEVRWLDWGIGGRLLPTSYEGGRS